MPDAAGRNHDPTLREITAELDGHRRLMDERDLRYSKMAEASEKAVAAALGAAEKLTNTAFAASEKAITKAEAAQSSYNASTNEFRGQLRDQAATLMPRFEADQRFSGLEQRFSEFKDSMLSEIANLRESRSMVQGEKGQASDSSATFFSVVTIVVACVAIVISVVTWLRP